MAANSSKGFRKISFVHASIPIFRYTMTVLIFYIEHKSITAVPYEQFQNDWTIKKYVMDERGFGIFEDGVR